MTRLQVAAIALLIVGAGLFAAGTSVEKSRHHDEPAATTESRASHEAGGESAEQHQTEAATSHTESSSEGKVLGIDRESPVLVLLAVLISLTLAALLWRRPSPAVWVAVGLVAVAFSVFDSAEVVHQLDESATGLAVLAGAVAAAHLTIVGLVGANHPPRAHPLAELTPPSTDGEIRTDLRSRTRSPNR